MGGPCRALPSSPGECWSLHLQPWKLPATPRLPTRPSVTLALVLCPHHGPSCSEGRGLGRTPHIHLTKSNFTSSEPGLGLALTWPPAPQVSPPKTFRGSCCRRGAVTEVCTVFYTVKWVRRPGLLAGSPSLGGTVGVSAYLSLSLASLKLSDTK